MLPDGQRGFEPDEKRNQLDAHQLERAVRAARSAVVERRQAVSASMMHTTPPSAVDLLGGAIEIVRPHLDRLVPLGQRARIFWAGVAAARHLGAADVVAVEFKKLASETGLTSDLGRHGEEDVRHLIWAGLRAWNPIYKGPSR